MIRLNIHEAKTHLSRYLDRLADGEVIILCKPDVPIAEIRGLPKPRVGPRPVGLAKRLPLQESPLRLIPYLREQQGVDSLPMDEESALHESQSIRCSWAVPAA